MPQVGATSPTPPWSQKVGPFAGVRDAIELSAQDVNRAAMIMNGYTPLPEIGTDVEQRAGVVEQAIPTTISSSAGFTGPTITLTGYTTPAGANINILLVRSTSNTGYIGAVDYFQVGEGSVFYVPVVYTAPSTYALINTGGGSIFPLNDPTTIANRMFVTALGSSIIFAQSGNKARLLTAGVMTDITDLGTDTVYGRPTIYYGKVFFIMNADRSTMKWSEENQPDTGYDATGFDNIWTLRQTGNAGMTALCGTNDALYVFRQNSITSITGAVNSDFRSAGTLDAISSSVGTLAPDSVCLVEDSVWFLDQFCRPQKLQLGRGLVPLWPNCAQTLLSADLTATTQFGNWGRYIPETEVVVFRIASTGTPLFLAFSSRTEEFLGKWNVAEAAAQTYTYGGMLFDAMGRLMLAETRDVVNMPLTFDTQKGNTATNQTDELTFLTASPSFSVKLPRVQSDLDQTINATTFTVSGQRDRAGDQARLDVTFFGSNVAAAGTAVQMTNATVADVQQPTRYVAQPDLRGSRWVQALITNFPGDLKRAYVGQVKVGGTQQRIDPTAP